MAIEGTTPQVECGRFPVKRVVGDVVRVTAAIYADGHDHVAARLVYRDNTDSAWNMVAMEPLDNDLWQASFTATDAGLWQFRIQAWIDHFDTWTSDLSKRIPAQPAEAVELKPGEPMREIPLALRTGASLLDKASTAARDTDARQLKSFASSLRWMADQNLARYDDPMTPEILELAKKYPDLDLSTSSADYEVRVERERARFSTWYEFFPRSAGAGGQHGTLKDAAARLPQIAEWGFDVVYFPPIHPIGTAFRKGKNNSVTAEQEDVGSPWAIGNRHGGHTAIASELGTLSDFDDLIAAASDAGVEIALDIAFQCSPDHPWVRLHPEWFLQRPDGSIQYAENPPKKYQDIYPLNFESMEWQPMWQELCGVFLFWARRGVRIFRVDNPHTKALPFWEWCLREVQNAYPDAIFLAEAFTRPHVMYALAKRGFTQSYTYFTWRETKTEITEYLQEVTSAPVSEFFRPNLWPNTPDILPGSLKKGGRSAFAVRAVLAATLGASYGVYGSAFELMESVPAQPGSEEYLDSEKYQLRDWSAVEAVRGTIMPLLQTLNHARRGHAALQRNETLHFHTIENPQMLCYSKRHGEDVILTIVNLDTESEQKGWTDLSMQELGLAQNAAYRVHDLLTGEMYRWQGAHTLVILDPAKAPAHLLHLQRSDEDGEQA